MNNRGDLRECREIFDGMGEREREKETKKEVGLEGSEGLKRGMDSQMPRCPEFLNGLKREEVNTQNCTLPLATHLQGERSTRLAHTPPTSKCSLQQIYF